MRRWPSHFGTLVVCLCLAAVVGLWLVSLQRIVFEKAQAVSSAMQANANLAMAFESQVISTLREAEQVAAFVRFSYSHPGAAPDLQLWANEQIIRQRAFTIINIVDANGRIVSSNLPSGASNYADESFLQQLRAHRKSDSLLIGKPVLGRVSGQWRVPISMRISSADGGFAGAVIMAVDPGYLSDLNNKLNLGANGMLEIAGLDGVIRSRKIGRHMRFGLDSGGHAWSRRQATEPEGGFVDNGDSTDGVTRIISYRTLEDYPLMITVGTDYDEVLQAANHRRLTYLGMAGGASVLLLGFGGLFLVMFRRQREAAEIMAENEALFRATFHQAASAMVRLAPSGRFLEVNDKFCRLLGYDEAEMLQMSVYDLLDPDKHQATREFLQQRMKVHFLGPPPEVEKQYRRRSGELLWVSESVSVVHGRSGLEDFLVAVVQDISARKELEARLSHDALHDALTGLPNRVMFHDRLQRALEAAKRHEQQVGILFLDLDGFKLINDHHGHAMGDLLLTQVARRLETCVRASSEDTVARFGGDEFGIVLASLSSELECEQVAEKILYALAQAFELNDDLQVQISSSIGATVYPIDGTEREELLARADSAMYRAKKSGKNRYCRFGA